MSAYEPIEPASLNESDDNPGQEAPPDRQQQPEPEHESIRHNKSIRSTGGADEDEKATEEAEERESGGGAV